MLSAFSGKKVKKAPVGNASSDNVSAESIISAMIDTQLQEFNPQEAIAKAIEISSARKFDESLELILKLNVDPTQGD